MRDEVIELRARIPRLEKEVARLERAARTSVRRAELANQKAQEARASGDPAGAGRAVQAAEAAVGEAEDLRRQAAEAAEDLARLKSEAAEKLERLKDAERNKSALLARARRAGTARNLEEMLRGPESGLRRFERAEEEMDTAEDLAAAADEVEEAVGGRSAPEADLELRRLEEADELAEVDRRLAELKRELRADGE